VELSTLDTGLVLAATTAVLLGIAAWLALRGRRTRRDSARLQVSVADKQHVPPSLHPIIDADICIGSLSCVRACPEGDILGLVEGKAKLVEASHCIGHSKCAVECPVDAIKLVFGTREKGVDLPETDERFESARPGVFIIGELGGMGLIKNAIRQGLDASSHLKAQLPAGRAGSDQVDVAIVGAGPAGIACAVGCAEQGLSARLLEQDTLGGTVAHYPRAKVVMTETVQVPFYGSFGRALISKEDLLAQLQQMLGAAKADVEEGTKVEGIDGELGAFTVQTSRGPVNARAVVLATGLRGSPRKLGVPGEDTEKVTYRLVDPTQYDGERVLVVGGGDSAVEAAIQLAQETRARVTISYRKESFSRAKPRNRELIAGLIADNRVRALMSSQVQRVAHGVVEIKTEDGEVGQLKNDRIIVCIGGELPTKFLQKAGVSVKRFHGESKAPLVRGSRDNRRLAAALSVLGTLIVAGLAFVGWRYYLLPGIEREEHALHELLRPAGLWGHGVGVIATLFMMSNFIYVLRKRWKRLKGAAHIRTWLTFHVFVGLMSPIVIAFHAAFQSKNLLATGTWVALAIVVGTGVFGRFLFGLVPSADGRLLALGELRGTFERAREHVTPLVHETTHPAQIVELLNDATDEPPRMSLLGALLWLHRRRYALQRLSERTKSFFPSEDAHREFQESLSDLVRLRLQVALYEPTKRLFRVWLAFHITLSVFMVFLIAAHVAISLYLGYGWILTDA
jgi:thioredoxin reductase/Pyruvate/2-oxoacid:ferredoxin oxidoreductase delta subunit